MENNDNCDWDLRCIRKHTHAAITIWSDRPSTAINTYHPHYNVR